MKSLRAVHGLVLLAFAFLAAAYFTGVRQGLDARINYGAVHDMWAMGIAISDGVYGLHKGYIGQPEVMQVLTEVITPDGLFAITDGNQAAVRNKGLLNAALKMATSLDKKDLVPFTEPFSHPFFVNWGEDSGQADWYQLAFFLFGHQATAMYHLYFTLFAASMLLFFAQHRSNFWAVGTLAMLTGTFWLLFYLDTFTVSVPSVNSNRFMASMVVIPTLHILMLLQQKRRLSRLELAGMALQALLIAFAISIRKSAQWSVMLIYLWIALQLVTYAWTHRPWKGKWQAAWQDHRSLGKLVLVFFLCTWGYNFVRMQMHHDIYFTDCMQPYRFTWHSAYLGFNTHPKWQTKYAPDYVKGIEGDGIGWKAAEHRYQQSSPCYEYVCQNVGSYPSGLHDKLMRKEFLVIARKHPGFMLQLYFWYKPKELFRRIDVSLHMVPAAAWLGLLAAFLIGVLAAQREKCGGLRSWKQVSLPLLAITVMTTAPHMFAYPMHVQDTTWMVMASALFLCVGAGLWLGRFFKPKQGVNAC